MATELQGPSVFQIKKFITNSTFVDIKLLSGEAFTGKIIWSDNAALLLQKEDAAKLMIMKNAISYISFND